MQRGGDTKPLAIFDKVFATPHADTNQPPSVVAATLEGVAYSVQPRQGCQSTPFEK
jgi:hypothetical protein